MRSGLGFKISDNIRIGPEFGFQVYSKNENLYYIEPGFSTYYSTFDPLGNVFILEESNWFGLTYKQRVKSNSLTLLFTFSPYYQIGFKKDVIYVYESYQYVGPETYIHKGGDLKIKNYGIESILGLLLINSNSLGLEFFVGGSLFYKNNSITYNEFEFQGYYSGSSYSEEYNDLQTKNLKRLDIKLQTGLNLVF